VAQVHYASRLLGVAAGQDHLAEVYYGFKAGEHTKCERNPGSAMPKRLFFGANFLTRVLDNPSQALVLSLCVVSFCRSFLAA
jgi:hypothetical protein